VNLGDGVIGSFYRAKMDLGDKVEGPFICNLKKKKNVRIISWEISREMIFYWENIF